MENFNLPNNTLATLPPVSLFHKSNRGNFNFDSNTYKSTREPYIAIPFNHQIIRPTRQDIIDAQGDLSTLAFNIGAHDPQGPERFYTRIRIPCDFYYLWPTEQDFKDALGNPETLYLN